MRAENREGRPTSDKVEAPSVSTAIKSEFILAVAPDVLSDLDAMAERLRGRLVVQVEVDGEKFRTHVYRSTAAAQRCVQRAAERGRRSHVTLVQMLPIGVVVGLGATG